MRLHIGAWLVWGFVATIVQTTILALGQGFRLTRMNVPYLLGTVVTPRRDRANVIGFFANLALGWLNAWIYIAAFHAWGDAAWWRGAAFGFVHAVFLLAAVMPILPGLHPRMAGEHSGPDVTRQLEPPGFLALHYGAGTPLSLIVAHVVYGIILGSFYRVPV